MVVCRRGDGAGRLTANLRAAGYRPEQIDEIYITHLGPDHVGGLTRGTERAFPNAMVRAPKNIKAGKFESIEEDIVLTPGIRALATHGHAPGHTSYVVESKGQTLIVMGDLVLMDALQFANPSLRSSFDADPRAAAEQRLRVFKMASEDDLWVAGAHLSFPGIGHIRAAQGRYFWAPAIYTIPQ